LGKVAAVAYVRSRIQRQFWGRCLGLSISLAADVCNDSVKALSECRLYAFVDTGYLRGRSPEAVARDLCVGGADLIQLRAKSSQVNEVGRLAAALLPITQQAGVNLVINDYPEIAKELSAEMCHLGQEDFLDSGYSQVSAVRGGARDLKVGLSTHAPEQAMRALAAGADYIAIGPVYATGTKPQATPVTLNFVRWAAVHVKIPWFAIGGINLGNLDSVLAAGARRICVVSAILNAPDIAAECRKFKERLSA
jgi:thiamine-phosphate pyrophosphorylase